MSLPIHSDTDYISHSPKLNCKHAIHCRPRKVTWKPYQKHRNKQHQRSSFILIGRIWFVENMSIYHERIPCRTWGASSQKEQTYLKITTAFQIQNSPHPHFPKILSPKIFHKHSFEFLSGLTMVPREMGEWKTKTNTQQSKNNWLKVWSHRAAQSGHDQVIQERVLDSYCITHYLHFLTNQLYGRQWISKNEKKYTVQPKHNLKCAWWPE